MASEQKKSWGVQQFQRIRRYLAPIYLYGFRSRDDFASANNGSAKNYDVVLNLLRQLFPNQEGMESKRSVHSIRRSYHLSGQHNISDAYMLHSLDVSRKMPEYLHILSRLRRGAAAYKDLESVIDQLDLPDANQTEGDQPKRNKKTVTSRRDTLVDYGVASVTKGSCSIDPDPLKELTKPQLQQLANYVDFSASVTYPRVAGSFLGRTVTRELYRRGMEPTDTTPFLLRHNTAHNILDEELIYQLRQPMEQHRFVFFDDRLRLPVKLRVDARLGRWYALCTDIYGAPCIEKITNTAYITPAEGEKPVSDALWAQAVDTVDAVFAHTLTSGEWGTPVTVTATLRFPEGSGIRNQFLREIPVGICDGDTYTATVSDPIELKPLLRAYGPYLQIRCDAPVLSRQLKEDYERMLAALDTEVSV